MVHLSYLDDVDESPSDKGCFDLSLLFLMIRGRGGADLPSNPPSPITLEPISFVGGVTSSSTCLTLQLPLLRPLTVRLSAQEPIL